LSDPSFAERRVDLGKGTALGVRLLAGGDRVPVLALHDLGGNARTWDDVAIRLAELGHPVAAVDQRGHGRSARPRSFDRFDLDTMTGDLVAVLDGLGWSAGAVVVGHGWGGNVALELAVAHPAQVSALALVEGGTIDLAGRFADWPTCEAAWTPPALDGRTASSVERLLELQHPDWTPAGLAAGMADLEVLPDGTVRPWLVRADYTAILRQLWDHHPAARYRSLKAPTLVVAAGDPAGQIARYDTARYEEAAVAAAAGLDVRWIDGDHELHLQYPDVIAGLVHSLTA
jgi:pimeloyl-ACP methyl ester carboxylesterase